MRIGKTVQETMRNLHQDVVLLRRKRNFEETNRRLRIHLNKIKKDLKSEIQL